jgi:outer membrane protein assembly factor BamB
LFGFRPDGSTKWPYYPVTIYDERPQASPAIGTNGLIYIGSDANYFYAINSSDGSGVYSADIGGFVSTCPAIDMAGYLYLGTSYNLIEIYRISPTLAAADIRGRGDE